jgi:CMP-N-acetylneuraminic acid synthetase
MLNKNKIFCIITARKNSKGLKGKNFKKIDSKPLIFYPVSAAIKSKLIDQVFFNSDCEKMCSYIKKKFKSCLIFERPKFLSGDKISSYEVISHQIRNLKLNEKYSYFVLLEPTSPLTEVSDIDKAITKLINNKKATSLISVCGITRPNAFYSFKKNKQYLIPLINKKEFKLRRQDLPKRYYIDGSLYLSNIKSYLKSKTFIQKKTLFIELQNFKNFQIDDYLDFEIMKTLYKKFYLKKNFI